jgi:hypothetical protein
MTLPEFTEGVHYRQLRGGSYRFELLKDITIEIPHLKKRGHNKEISFRDHLRREWVRIKGSFYTIRKGYRWNGCSPKRWLPIIGWVGTIDFIRTRLASCFHDTGFQFLLVADYPLSFQDVNEVFRDIMAALKFRLTNAYHGAVRDFGKHFSGDYPERGEHSIILAP